MTVRAAALLWGKIEEVQDRGACWRGALLVPRLRGTRGANHNTTELVSTGPTGGNGAISSQYRGASADGTRVIFQTTEQLVAADTDTRMDIYERAAGTTTLLSPGRTAATATSARPSARPRRTAPGSSSAPPRALVAADTDSDAGPVRARQRRHDADVRRARRRQRRRPRHLRRDLPRRLAVAVRHRRVARRVGHRHLARTSTSARAARRP